MDIGGGHMRNRSENKVVKDLFAEMDRRITHMLLGRLAKHREMGTVVVIDG